MSQKVEMEMENGEDLTCNWTADEVGPKLRSLNVVSYEIRGETLLENVGEISPESPETAAVSENVLIFVARNARNSS